MSDVKKKGSVVQDVMCTCTAPQNGAASAMGSAAGEQPGAVNMILLGGLDTKSNIAFMAAALSH